MADLLGVGPRVRREGVAGVGQAVVMGVAIRVPALLLAGPLKRRNDQPLLLALDRQFQG